MIFLNGSLNIQMLIFLYSCVLGIGLGFLYDIFRIIRIMINPKNIVVFIQDVIYFIISGIVTFLFVLVINNGEARFYILSGEGIGWVIYHLTLGEIMYKYSYKIIKMANLLIEKIICKFKKITKLFNLKIKN